MSETEAQKRERILHTERDHSVNAPPVTRAAIVVEQPPGEDIDAPFHTLLAHTSKWFAPRGMRPTSVVIHATAATNPASSTANFFHASTPSGSTQSVADDNEGFTCVPDDAVCAGAPPLNQEGLHIEQPGLEAWARSTWLSHPDDLHRVAFHVAQWCKAYDIPVVLLHAADLVRLGEKARGITYHKAISDAFHQSTHQDPGPGFPWDVFMPLVQGFVDGTGGDDLAILTDDQQHYLQGALRYLNAIGAPPADADPKVREGFAETKARFEAAGGGGGGGASKTHVHDERVTGPPREP